MSFQTEKLRELIRSGAISPDKNRMEWEWAVARIYEVERREEALNEMVKLSEDLGLYEVKKCLVAGCKDLTWAGTALCKKHHDEVPQD